MATARPPPTCECCQARYATTRYTDDSYCTRCASLQPNKGTEICKYEMKQQILVFGTASAHSERDYPCECCKFAFRIRSQVETLFYNCGHKYDFCYKCASKHKVCPKDPDYKLNQEGLKQLLKLKKNNK